MLVRDTCVSLVQCAEDRFTSVGSTGMMTEQGLAYLVWQDGAAMLSVHGSQIPADPAQVAAIQKFSQDLKEIIGPRPSA